MNKRIAKADAEVGKDPVTLSRDIAQKALDALAHMPYHADACATCDRIFRDDPAVRAALQEALR